jgi:predicted nuclease of predicted toxin-antitoxin system
VARFLVDEDLPRSLARLLRAAGVGSDDVRDVGLRGEADDVIFEYAVSHGFALLTADLGFGNILRFRLGSHAGIIVVRFPNEVSSDTQNEAVSRTLRDLSDDEIRGSLIVIEPGRVRLRRAG